MRRISPTNLAPFAVAIVFLFAGAVPAIAQKEDAMRGGGLGLGGGLYGGLGVPAIAQKDDALRAEVVKIGQVTGKDTYEAQLELLVKDQKHAKKLVATAVKMAKAKEPGLSYYGAMTVGQLALEFKDYKACETLFPIAMTKAVQLYSRIKILESYLGLIESHYDHKKYADVVRVCRELLELKTGDGERIFRVFVEDRFGDFDYPVDPDFDVVKPLRPYILPVMIQALAKDGKYDQALKFAESLVRASDGWKERQLRGVVLREAGRIAEATKVYEDVLERIAKDEDLSQKEKDQTTDRTRYTLSNLYIEIKQIDKAADLLKALIDRHPDQPGFYNDLGYVWADNDMNLKEAEVLIRKALDLDREKRKKSENFNPAEDKDKGAYLDSLGWVLFKQKRYDDAKKYLQEALKDDDAQHIEIFDHLGETYLALGQPKEAVKAWIQGLKVAGDDRTELERKKQVEKKIEKYK